MGGKPHQVANRQREDFSSFHVVSIPSKLVLLRA